MIRKTERQPTADQEESLSCLHLVQHNYGLAWVKKGKFYDDDPSVLFKGERLKALSSNFEITYRDHKEPNILGAEDASAIAHSEFFQVGFEFEILLRILPYKELP